MTQAFLVHNRHQASGLIWPSTSLQVLDSAMKCTQPLHFCSPFGCVWYCMLACVAFPTIFGVAESALGVVELAGAVLLGVAPFFESHPKRVIGNSRLALTASAVRNICLRGRISSFDFSLGCILLPSLIFVDISSSSDYKPDWRNCQSGITATQYYLVAPYYLRPIVMLFLTDLTPITLLVTSLARAVRCKVDCSYTCEFFKFDIFMLNFLKELTRTAR